MPRRNFCTPPFFTSKHAHADAQKVPCLGPVVHQDSVDGTRGGTSQSSVGRGPGHDVGSIDIVNGEEAHSVEGKPVWSWVDNEALSVMAAGRWEVY